MSITSYATPAAPAAERLIADLFKLGNVGYVALGAGNEVLMRIAPGLISDTSAETNFYEELLVNPTLLKLAMQRGHLDCGGLAYIAIGYGYFMQVVMPTKTGHVSIGVPRSTQPGELAARVEDVLSRHDCAGSVPAPCLLAP